MNNANGHAPDMALNFHLMHPGGDSSPGDPNAAFYLDGVYHLHYILGHPWKDGRSYSFVHVTSPDMLHWTWQPTKLQPAFTGHGMFSGTGFLTKEGLPAVIYHGQRSGRNQIAIAKDRRLSGWERPYPVEVRNPDGSEAAISRHWDPDCFLINGAYYAISGGLRPPLFKSRDLRNWTLIGDFLSREFVDVTIGEDISCPNFFPLGDRWMLLCISHPFGCRYYIGDWDAAAQQFVPQRHGRMTWRRDDEPVFTPSRRDVFAPESVLTPDGRRVMWVWLYLGGPGIALQRKTIQSLPRELSLPADGVLRIRPLRELQTLRHDPVVLRDLRLSVPIAMHGPSAVPPSRSPELQRLAELPGDACEIRVVIPREQALRKLFGFVLFADDRGGGLPILLRPENGTLRVGSAEGPFAVSDLPADEDVELRIFIDKYLVEVFANGRQALPAAHLEYAGAPRLDGFTFGEATAIKTLEIWKLHPANQGYLEARETRVWEPATEPTTPTDPGRDTKGAST